jgi:hypothetical protein
LSKEFYVSFAKVRIGRFLFMLIAILLMLVLHPFLESYIAIRIQCVIMASMRFTSGEHMIRIFWFPKYRQKKNN